jgi:hypothetical protein
MTEIGTRVWAVRDATDKVVNAYGFGTYVGDEIMPGWDHPSMLARCESTIRRSDAKPSIIDPHVYYQAKVDARDMTREEADTAIARVEDATAAERARPLAERVAALARACSSNPKIELDSGGYVWGAECWWGEAADDTPSTWAKGRRIVTVPAPERSATR